jgi:L-rhamnonate dehydratase
MRITAVEPIVLRADRVDTTRAESTQDAFLVRVHTDEPRQDRRGRHLPIPRMDDDRHALVAPDRPRLREVLVGEDPLQIDRLWQLLYRASYHYGLVSWAKQIAGSSR